MSKEFQAMVQKTYGRMQKIPCTCEAITEPHVKGDCGPMWHAVNWHKRDVHSVDTAAEARTQYPHCGCSDTWRTG
jgi:hypothetical protein